MRGEHDAASQVSAPVVNSSESSEGTAPAQAPASASVALERLPAAVLWDMDGTLVDAEPQWIEAERRAMRRHGATWSHEQGLQLVGSALPTSGRVLAAHLAKTVGVQVEPSDLVTEILDSMVDELAAGVTWRPGAIKLLEELHQLGVPCALVTMSYRRLATVVSDQIPGRFRVLVCGDEVRHGKPAPDPYLRAADLLGVGAADCVAIEDSPTGVDSAEAAGCQVLACPYPVPIPTGPGRKVVSSLTEVDLGLLCAIAASSTGSAGHHR